MPIAQLGMGADDTGPVEAEGEAVFPEDGLFDTPLTWRVEYRYANGVKLIYTDNRKCSEGARFKATPEVRAEIRPGLLACAESLLASGNKDEAEAIYREAKK